MVPFVQSVSFPHAHTCHFDSEGIDREIDTFFVRGQLQNATLTHRIAALDQAFSIYAGSYPFGLWAEGLVVSQEMAGLTEQYLPITEISKTFLRLLTLSLRFPPLFEATPFPGASSWLDVLPRLHPQFQNVNPAALLAMACCDEGYRLRLTFSLFLPRKYGGGFHRYPRQEAFIKGWVAENRGHCEGGIRCLDAGCGSGEGTYSLASVLHDSCSSLSVRGESVEPIELFSACHAFTPHDLKRQEQFRSYVAQLPEKSVSIALWNVSEPSQDRTKYHVVVCNGLLGGPMLSDPHRVRQAVHHLVARLEKKALFVAADHFHDGWKKGVSRSFLQKILCDAGLNVIETEEGVAGQSTT